MAGGWRRGVFIETEIFDGRQRDADILAGDAALAAQEHDGFSRGNTVVAVIDDDGIFGEDDLVLARPDFSAAATGLAVLLHDVDMAGRDERFEIFLPADGVGFVADAGGDDIEAVTSDAQIVASDDDIAGKDGNGFGVRAVHVERLAYNNGVGRLGGTGTHG